MSPKRSIKNKLYFFTTPYKRYVNFVTVFNGFDNGGDHRKVRAAVQRNLNSERTERRERGEKGKKGKKSSTPKIPKEYVKTVNRAFKSPSSDVETLTYEFKEAQIAAR